RRRGLGGRDGGAQAGEQLQGVAASLLGGVPRGEALGRALLAAGEVGCRRGEGGAGWGLVRPALPLGLGASVDGGEPAFVRGFERRECRACRGGLLVRLVPAAERGERPLAERLGVVLKRTELRPQLPWERVEALLEGAGSRDECGGR